MAITTLPLVPKSKNETVNKIVTNAVPILAIGVLGGVAYVAYKLLKKEAPPKLYENKNYPSSSLSQVQALAIADRLYAAMKGLGTDEVAVMKALSGLDYNDFVKVYEAFGKRQYSTFWGNIGDPLTSKDHHLITWLTNELKPSEIKQLEQVIPNLLSVGK